MIIRSNKIVNKPKLNWITAPEPHPCHLAEFTHAATLGVEIIYTGEDNKSIDKDYFLLETDLIIKTPIYHSLLIIPHHNYYLNPEATPLPVMTLLEMDWWFKPLKIMFRKTKAKLKANMPVAQAIAVPREEYIMQQMSDNEKHQIESTSLWFEKNKSKYITRACKVNDLEFDNAYAVLCNIAKNDDLPQEIKKTKVKLRFHETSQTTSQKRK